MKLYASQGPIKHVPTLDYNRRWRKEAKTSVDKKFKYGDHMYQLLTETWYKTNDFGLKYYSGLHFG